MKKLCCDICGGALTMQSSGKTAVCDNCGMQYSVERMREKVQEIKGTVSVEGTVRTQDADFIIRGGVLERYNGNDPHVIIPDSVVRIGENAFSNCLGIKSVALCPSVIEIGGSAFNGCKFLERVEFSDALEVIRSGAFYGCQSLKKVSLPETVKEIGYGAFSECINLETINIPEHTVCGTGAFESCSALREVIISEAKKEELLDNGIRYMQDIFEETNYDSDGIEEYSSGRCGPWYINLKHTLLEEERKRIQEKWKEENKCPYCGGRFSGFFTTKCVRCGKPKDY